MQNVTLSSLGKVNSTRANTGRATPVILDLGGDGIDYLSLDAGVKFDYNQDGITELTAWVGTKEGILAIQRQDGSMQITFSTNDLLK